MNIVWVAYISLILLYLNHIYKISVNNNGILWSNDVYANVVIVWNDLPVHIVALMKVR
jgi:hypothetical protein